MVLMSTSHVEPHTSGFISSFFICLIQAELQMVLIGTVSTFFLSSLSSPFSCVDLMLEESARPLPLRRLSLWTAATTQRVMR